MLQILNSLNLEKNDWLKIYSWADKVDMQGKENIRRLEVIKVIGKVSEFTINVVVKTCKISIDMENIFFMQLLNRHDLLFCWKLKNMKSMQW